ncbi:MAG: glycosyltransferase, partial [Gemmataceae bacterium]
MPGLDGLHRFASRGLAAPVLRGGADLGVVPAERVPTRDRLPPDPALEAVRNAPPAGPVAAWVRHGWPPRFDPPPAGAWVLAQPWEYGPVPRGWVRPVADAVDEVWAYTRHVRDAYLEAGMPADRVHVVPLGVDPAAFRPGLAPLPLPTRKRVKLLFVGGTIRRKGFDALLAAYRRAFTAADDVSLVVCGMGADSIYLGQTGERLVAALQADPAAPEVVCLTGPVPDGRMGRLYAACDALIAPYRGEGFGLPIAEAMGCGLPVVVTGAGAAVDFCAADRAYLLPARRTPLTPAEAAGLPPAGGAGAWWYEPDPDALAETLRHLAGSPASARAKGAAAAGWVREHLTWDRAAATALARVRALQGDRPRRLRPSAVVVPATARDRPRVSLCMIVRDEEHNLPDCLRSAADLVDEVVVVDTGSADRTREVARRFGARVVDRPWPDSFAAARNASLDHATGEWAFWLDADDRVGPADRDRLRAVLAGLGPGPAAYAMTCRCAGPAGEAPTLVDHVRLF